MNNTIIVAIDGGIASEAALHWAAEWARSVQLDLELCTIADLAWSPENERLLLPAYQRVLDAAVGEIAELAGPVRVTATLRHGNPTAELIGGSRSAALLVIGTHKTSRLAGLIHGTLPLKVAAETVCPLVVVPATWTTSSGPVVVGVDDDTDHRAIDFAADAARRLGEPLLLVHAWDVPSTVATDFLGRGDLYESMRDGNAALLTKVAGRLRRAHDGLTVTERLVYGNPAIALSEAAEGASLAVVGTHHRRAIAGMILGSVSHDILMNMPCPIAVVPPGQLTTGSTDVVEVQPS
ncbi:MAG TPA: universal stress protein [Lacisediminihabitans sp.]|uniref:universal stress protein n=1 Tax=Lacisediminihabitans sp. TaxID=2787631 RepID=UPI002ED99E35